ncbi:MAG: hypothetical protein KDI75_05795 [Xanthomonadales bacterium]|nr:hypothetical protein [Xanthomonadales bacterium]
MLHRSLLLLSLLFAAHAHAGTASHAGPNGNGCQVPAVETVATSASEGPTTAESAIASPDAKSVTETPRREPVAPPVLQWRSFLPGMFK